MSRRYFGSVSGLPRTQGLIQNLINLLTNRPFHPGAFMEVPGVERELEHDWLANPFEKSAIDLVRQASLVFRSALMATDDTQQKTLLHKARSLRDEAQRHLDTGRIKTKEALSASYTKPDWLVFADVPATRRIIGLINIVQQSLNEAVGHDDTTKASEILFKAALVSRKIIDAPLDLSEKWQAQTIMTKVIPNIARKLGTLKTFMALKKEG